ncbi:putative adoMet-dependent tRNA methyltransferase complex subunit Trm112 [Ascodesmis nigricans]|uniref:Multifunctional methyltransferase subunit trm112 n=1 Tax=Ascodesmis nigricans TaxID=341454 RepID=A0A4S2N4B6_9PEZI|nr:putative adoMet-dependent tRNA methyltransferase complex subunit Trm112 [Ascodesmis nigricans]
MKILTTNYLACAVKTCKSEPAAFPLHFKDAELAREELELNPEFIKNVLPRIDWPALAQTAAELGFTTLPSQKPENLDEQTMKDLHTLLMETQVMEGKLVCGNCGYEYNIKEGIANFLLPNHLV